MLTVPLRLEGTNSHGERFEAEGRTVFLNRHGARIHTLAALRGGQTIRVTNLANRRAAEFRVVGPTAPRSESGGEWGVEAANPETDLWGIRFPPPVESPPRALLACRECQGMKLAPLSVVEVEVLETAGLFTRPCEDCGKPTPWGYAEKHLTIAAPPGEDAMIAEGRRAATVREQRLRRRVALQLSVLIRDYYGGAEIAQTENVSKSGFCFSSEKTYQVGQGVMVICPYDPAANNPIEISAHIVRRELLEGAMRKVYGVRYDASEPSSGSPAR
jgi:hypothetical protein